MNAMKLCDLHTHVLPNVDDGAPNMDTAVQMLRNAVASDVAVLAVTPHWSRPFDPNTDPVQDLQLQFSQLVQAAADIPIRLVLGAEVRADEHLLPNLRNGKTPTLNGSRYLLTEFSVDAAQENISQMLQDILSLGYTPLIAHPERYLAVRQTPATVMPWLDMGCHLQLTGGSILGEYGKTVQAAAKFLLQQDLVACIASDAHGAHHRSNFLLDVYDHLSVRYSRQYAQCLMYENPMAICHNENL